MNKHNLSIFNYSINNSNDDGHLDVYIDGEVVDAETQEIREKWWGDETSVSFKSLRNQVLKSTSKSITFWVNSYGGHVGDAMAIHDWIKELENSGYKIQTKGIGMVCSAASFIVSAAEDSSMTENSWYMIHNVSGGIFGDVIAIENYARVMRKFNNAIADFYKKLTGMPLEVIIDWMNSEKWFTGIEAKDYGFVKNISKEEPKIKNSIDPKNFPYKNKNALMLYNQYVMSEDSKNKNINKTCKNNLGINMKKLQDAVINVFKTFNNKEESELENKEQPQKLPVTDKDLSNAITAALKNYDISEKVNNYLEESFKDGLPENIQQAIITAISNSVKETMKNYPTPEDILNVSKEIEDVKEKLINSYGGAKGSEENKEQITDEYNHPGIKWV